KVVSNIAFGGPQHDEIFCTTGEPPGVFHAAVGVKGFAGHPGKPFPILRTLNLVALRPHADAEALRGIVGIATESAGADGKLDEAARRKIESRMAGLTDPQVRGDMRELAPAFDAAASRHFRDRALLTEVQRLGGKATIEVAAPDWLRSIAGDDSLALFG